RSAGGQTRQLTVHFASSVSARSADGACNDRFRGGGGTVFMGRAHAQPMRERGARAVDTAFYGPDSTTLNPRGRLGGTYRGAHQHQRLALTERQNIQSSAEVLHIEVSELLWVHRQVGSL